MVKSLVCFFFSLGGLYLSHLPFPLRDQWEPACLNLAHLSHSVLSLGEGERGTLGMGWMRETKPGQQVTLECPQRRGFETPCLTLPYTHTQTLLPTSSPYPNP